MSESPPAEYEGQRFWPAYRIRSAADFRRAYALKRSAGDNLLVVYAASNGLAHPRLGLSVSRRVGNAVRRNRWKRLLREAFRLSVCDLPPGVDLVAIPRPDAEPTLLGLRSALISLARRANRKLPAVKPPPEAG